MWDVFVFRVSMIAEIGAIARFVRDAFGLFGVAYVVGAPRHVSIGGGVAVMDAEMIFEYAYRHEHVIFVPGITCYANGGHHNTARLCFANLSLPMIEEGISRLARVFHKFCD